MTGEGWAWPQDDEQAIRDAYWQILPGDVVIDVGAHMGEYTMPALMVGASVWAIDSDDTGLLFLRACAAAHGLAERLKITRYAVYDGGPYPAELMAEIAGSVHHALAPLAFPRWWATLDDLILTGDVDVAKIDYVKVDVEGGELGVLFGAGLTLARYRPRVLIEDHTRIYPWVARQRSAERITGLLHGLDYEVESVYHEGVGASRDFIVGTPL